VQGRAHRFPYYLGQGQEKTITGQNEKTKKHKTITRHVERATKGKAKQSKTKHNKTRQHRTRQVKTPQDNKRQQKTTKDNTTQHNVWYFCHLNCYSKESDSRQL
jgi:hypothetical protein